MDVSQAETVLATLAEVYALDDVQAIVDLACRRAVELSPYRLALLSLYFGDDVYIGLEGGDEEMRQSFLKVARQATPEGRARRRQRIWEKHRIDGTHICFMAEDSDIPFGMSFHPSESVPGSEWRPNDRLMVFVRDAHGEVSGVLSLDRPSDGRRPDPKNLGPLVWVDRFITLMGVVIHNKHLQAKLRESEQRYAAVVEQGHDGILIVRDGRILFANTRIGEMLGVPPSLLVGRAADKVIGHVWAASLPGETDGHLLRPDGRTVDVSLRTSTIRVGGADARLFAVADITERKRILTQLVRAKKMESVGTLASGIAHDFNNLLTGILGSASLAAMRVPPDSPAAEQLSRVLAAAEKAAELTSKMLAYAGKGQFHLVPLDLNQVIEEVLPLVRSSLGKTASIQLALAPNLPAIEADASQLQQVVVNLLTNAAEASAREIVVRTGAMTGGDLSPLPSVFLEVKDDGAGMDEETRVRIFDPFFSTKFTGRGLGLSAVAGIVSGHGGKIRVESRRSRGTCFTVLFPAKRPDESSPSDPLPEDARLASETGG